MDGILELFQYEFGIRALYASIMVGMMCGVLGCFIVLRNMALIGDALSHAVLPGVVVGFVVAGAGALGIFTGAVIAGLLAAFLITWIQRNANTKNDAAIGIVFTAMFAIGVMAISKVSRKGAHLDLDHFLFGNVLGLNNADLYLTGFITVFVLASVILFYRYLFATTFQPVIAQTMGISVSTMHYYLMLLLAFSVVVSLQSVGVILVVAMLITPASTALLLTNRLKSTLVVSALIGVIASVLGLVITNFYNTTPGPAMAVTASAIYLLAVFFAPEKGLVFRNYRKRKNRFKILVEDTLKQSLKLQENANLKLDSLAEKLSISKFRLRRTLSFLKKQGKIKRDGNQILLTETGKKDATKLVRAHRLWETYLVERMGLNAEQIHEDAENYEHLLTEELMDEVDATLGFPKLDPHGSPIPQKGIQPALALSEITAHEKATIAPKQLNEQLMAELWQLGLFPETSFEVISKSKESLIIQAGGKQIKLPFSFARTVNVMKETAVVK